jgi:hypothetical protein
VDEYIRTLKEASLDRELIRNIGRASDLIQSNRPRSEIADLLTKITSKYQAAGPHTESDAPVSLRSLTGQFPHLRQPIIEGLARQGEVINVIAKTKVGKSWLAYYILICIATGTTLFGRFKCKAGRVLLVDNELHRETIAHRIPVVAEAMGFQPDHYQDKIDVIALRGNLCDINQMALVFDRCRDQEYQLIVLDALYRMLPNGVAENANEGLAQVYNRLDQYAAMTGAAFMPIHHATKGGQADKDITDVGSGAGAQSRAADTHIILRPHQEDDCVVLDAVMRSWQPIEPVPLRWNFPLWIYAEDIDPTALKGGKPRHEVRRQQDDQKGTADILQALSAAGEPETVKGLTERLPMGPARIRRLVGGLVQSGQVNCRKVTKRGQACNEYWLF